MDRYADNQTRLYQNFLDLCSKRLPPARLGHRLLSIHYGRQSGGRSGTKLSLLISFCSAASFATVFDLLPISFPFFSPAKRPTADGTDFARKVGFLECLSVALHNNGSCEEAITSDPVDSTRARNSIARDRIAANLGSLNRSRFLKIMAILGFERNRS